MEKTVAPVVVAEFELEPDDIAKLNTQFGEGVLKSPRLTLSKDYSNNLQYKRIRRVRSRKKYYYSDGPRI